jgi:hypothetical protein
LKMTLKESYYFNRTDPVIIIELLRTNQVSLGLTIRTQLKITA